MMKVLNTVSGGTLLVFLTVLLACTNGSKVEFFVSPDGSDENIGTASAPFRSLEQARDAVREQLQETPGKAISVIVRGGTYYLDAPVIFTSEDAGTGRHPVVYRAADGEEPVFTGSRELSGWQLLEDAEQLGVLRPEAKGKVFVSDLKAVGISNFGDPTDVGQRPELFSNGKLQTLSRWPNTGFIKAGLAKGKTALPENYTKKHGTVEGVFEYTNKWQDRWAGEEDVRLGGYWYWDWADQFQKVENIDTRTGLIHISEPYHNYGYKDSLRYFGVNLFSEIDAPGEWYLDRADGLLYWFPPEGTVPTDARVTLSVFDAPFMVELRNTSHITLEGLSFQEGRGSAISISEGTNCVVLDCRVERFGRDGIHIMGGSDHRISGSLLRTFGHGGIKIKGGDRKTLTPANHVVENTVVEYFSLFKRTYEPAVHIDGCGITIRNNRFSHSSSSAMRLEGNDVIVEYNEINHVVNESDDQGGLDVFYNPSYRGNVVRYNRWSDIKGGTLHGAAGIRLDDMISGFTIFGNVFERCGAVHFGGVQIHGGKDNMVANNLFFDCLGGFSFSPWGEERWLGQLESDVIKKKIYEDVDIRSELYQNRYPELKTLREGVDVNTIKDNLLVDCETDFVKNPEKAIKINNTMIQSDGKGIEYFCSDEVLKQYGLQPIPLKEIGPHHNRWIN